MKKVVAEGRTVEEAIEKALAQLHVTNEKVEKKILEMPSKGIMGIFGAKNAKVELTVIEETPSEPKRVLDQASIEKTAATVSPIDKKTWETPLQEDDTTVHDDVEQVAVDFLTELFEKFGIKATCIPKMEQRNLSITIEGDDMGILIGRRGQTLDAIQYLTSLVVNKGAEEYVRVIIDTENYREKREVTLKELAFKLAKKKWNEHARKSCWNR
jgi:spoIIIJ-associated protein